MWFKRADKDSGLTWWAHCHDCSAVWLGPDLWERATAHALSEGHFTARHVERISGLTCEPKDWNYGR